MGSRYLIAGGCRSWVRAPATIDGSAVLLCMRENPLWPRPRRRWRQRFLAFAAQKPSPQQQQAELNVSVLRFTFGIPGFDESYLPRYIGLAFGSLIVLNHFLSDAAATPAQLRSEVVGLFLAVFSTALPYFGRFLKGANPVDRTSLPVGNRQIFTLSEDTSVSQKEDLAWASFALLRNTNSMSVLIAVNDVLCVRGYWNIPEEFSRDQQVEWFKTHIPQTGFLDLKDTIYLPQISDTNLGIVLPKGALSVLVQPVYVTLDQTTYSGSMFRGFVLLVSSSVYAYGEKDRAWIKAVSNKLRYRKQIQDSQVIDSSVHSPK